MKQRASFRPYLHIPHNSETEAFKENPVAAGFSENL
jgi:hypothetical protein